jgi:polyadenylate-binding protein
MPFNGSAHSVGDHASPVQVGTEELKEAFKDAGEIVSAVVMRDQAGVSRGFGFVNFSHPEDADRAVAEYGSVPPGQSSWLVSALIIF